MRGEAEKGANARTPNPCVWWVRMLIPVPTVRHSHTEATPAVHRGGLPAGAPTPRSSLRGRPDSFGYEPFMCTWEHQHTERGTTAPAAQLRP